MSRHMTTPCARKVPGRVWSTDSLAARSTLSRVTSTGGQLFRAAVVGLLVAVGTAASLIISAVHGFWIVVAVICAALAAGLVACANSLKKNLSGATDNPIVVTLR